MVYVPKMSEEEQRAVFNECTKEDLITMLIEANKVISMHVNLKQVTYVPEKETVTVAIGGLDFCSCQGQRQVHHFGSSVLCTICNKHVL